MLFETLLLSLRNRARWQFLKAVPSKRARTILNGDVEQLLKMHSSDDLKVVRRVGACFSDFHASWQGNMGSKILEILHSLPCKKIQAMKS